MGVQPTRPASSLLSPGPLLLRHTQGFVGTQVCRLMGLRPPARPVARGVLGSSCWGTPERGLLLGHRGVACGDGGWRLLGFGPFLIGALRELLVLNVLTRLSLVGRRQRGAGSPGHLRARPGLRAASARVHGACIRTHVSTRRRWAESEESRGGGRRIAP